MEGISTQFLYALHTWWEAVVFKTINIETPKIEERGLLACLFDTMPIAEWIYIACGTPKQNGQFYKGHNMD